MSSRTCNSLAARSCSLPKTALKHRLSNVQWPTRTFSPWTTTTARSLRNFRYRGVVVQSGASPRGSRLRTEYPLKPRANAGYNRGLIVRTRCCGRIDLCMMCITHRTLVHANQPEIRTLAQRIHSAKVQLVISRLQVCRIVAGREDIACAQQNVRCDSFGHRHFGVLQAQTSIVNVVVEHVGVVSRHLNDVEVVACTDAHDPLLGRHRSGETLDEGIREFPCVVIHGSVEIRCNRRVI